MVHEVSGSLIVRDQKILLLKKEGSENYKIPMGYGEEGELSADAAERVASEVTGCGSQVERYKKKLKNSFEDESEEITMQPYKVNIEGEPEQGEWVEMHRLSSINLHPALADLTEEVAKRL